MQESFDKYFNFENSIDDSFMSNMSIKLRDFLNIHNMTVRKFSDLSGVPMSTLNHLLYNDLTDCKLSTAIYIARMLGISIDELIDAKTINPIVQQHLLTFRDLPENSKHLIRWFIRYQSNIYKNSANNREHVISVMKPYRTNDGVAKLSYDFLQVDITDQPKDIKSKVFFGIRISSDLLIPYYFPSTILLIANDRKPFPQERVVVLVGDTLFLTIQRYENGHFNYYGLRDGKFRCNESGVDEVIGYVAGTIIDMSENR